MYLLDKLRHLPQLLRKKLLNRGLEIKVGDIVDYEGLKCRVMSIDEDNTTTILSKLFYWEHIPIRYLKLIESISLPELEPGDMVQITHVTDDEITTYKFPWSNTMRKIVKEGNPVEVLRVENDFYNHPTVAVSWEGGYVWFMTYHVEKVNDYDFV